MEEYYAFQTYSIVGERVAYYFKVHLFIFIKLRVWELYPYYNKLMKAII